MKRASETPRAGRFVHISAALEMAVVQLELFPEPCAASAHEHKTKCWKCGWNSTHGSLPWETDNDAASRRLPERRRA